MIDLGRGEIASRTIFGPLTKTAIRTRHFNPILQIYSPQDLHVAWENCGHTDNDFLIILPCLPPTVSICGSTLMVSLSGGGGGAGSYIFFLVETFFFLAGAPVWSSSSYFNLVVFGFLLLRCSDG